MFYWHTCTKADILCCVVIGKLIKGLDFSLIQYTIQYNFIVPEGKFNCRGSKKNTGVKKYNKNTDKYIIKTVRKRCDKIKNNI